MKAPLAAHLFYNHSKPKAILSLQERQTANRSARATAFPLNKQWTCGLLRRKERSQGASPWRTNDLEYKTNYNYCRVWSRTLLSSCGLSRAST